MCWQEITNEYTEMIIALRKNPKAPILGVFFRLLSPILHLATYLIISIPNLFNNLIMRLCDIRK